MNSNKYKSFYFVGANQAFENLADKIKFCFNQKVKRLLNLSDVTIEGLDAECIVFIDTKCIDSDMGGMYSKVSEMVPVSSVIMIGSKPKAPICSLRIKKNFVLSDIMDIALHLEKKQNTKQILGNSKAISDIRKIISLVSGSKSTVLITGESGTGKEVVSHNIHSQSLNGDGPFVVINCGAIPENLFESELFGYKKGSFTGAYTNQAGKIESANNGTLFLDEVGDMPLPMQVKLLRVLQEKSVCRIGEYEDRPVNVRVVAATNANLLERVSKGEFREDLYYRLNVIPVEIPPLRERVSDIEVLINNFIDVEMESDSMIALKEYPWPGNVRELSNFAERKAVFYPNTKLTKYMVESLLGDTSSISVDCDGSELKSDSMDISIPVKSIEMNIDIGTTPIEMNLKDEVLKFERNIIQATLATNNNSIKEASEVLGVKRTTLIEKIKRMGIND